MTNFILDNFPASLNAWITELILKSPNLLQPILSGYWHGFSTAIQAKQLALAEDRDFFSSLNRVWSISDFSAQVCLAHPELILELWHSKDLSRSYSENQYQTRLSVQLQEVTDQAGLYKAVRKFKRREYLRIIWRDCLRWSDFSETVRDLTRLADVCVQQALAKLQAWLQSEWGEPLNEKGELQSLIVIAVGKLGGSELNLSSDIDMIFTYPDAGYTAKGPRSVSNEEFFLRLARTLIHCLHQLTEDGYVFRVDMRLRPFGNSGPLAMSFSAMEDYYRTQGRDWERYALVKARVITGNSITVKPLMQTIIRFVYRPYLDYSALNALRDLKKLIHKEAQARGLEDNIKRGLGGIREIEFMVQVFQLIRGGSSIELQQQNMLLVLQILQHLSILQPQVIEDLHAAYLFLRNTEHKLQSIHDRQTHLLPKHDVDQTRLAFAMNYSDWSAFLADLNLHREKVREHFADIIEQPKTSIVMDRLVAQQSALQLVWRGELATEAAQQLLLTQGFRQAPQILQELVRLHASEGYQKLSESKKTIFAAVIPLCLAVIAQINKQSTTCARVMKVLEATFQKTEYATLLIENQKAIEQLIALCQSSPWIAQQLCAYPALLEELVDSRALYAPLSETVLAAELRQYLVGIAQQDLEQQMNGLRRFKYSHVLRVAAADTMNILPLMKVSDHLTFTASVILREAEHIALNDLILHHGVPTDENNQSQDVHFCIVGYGKLGGIELSYGSDLDLVFLCSEVNDKTQTDGKHPIGNFTFYTKLAQKIIHILGATVSEGKLFEVDTRLRPSGTSGLIVNTLSAFTQYQLQEAWTWEHQALVRAQPISGSEQIKQRFLQIRKEVLSVERDVEQLKKEVTIMRKKMFATYRKPAADKFDVKQGLWGINDIEFIAQFGVLCYGHRYPSLLVYPDNIRIFESLAGEKLITAAQSDFLCDAYRSYRSVAHRCNLQNVEPVVEEQHFHEYRVGIEQIWRQFIGTTVTGSEI